MLYLNLSLPLSSSPLICTPVIGLICITILNVLSYLKFVPLILLSLRLILITSVLILHFFFCFFQNWANRDLWLHVSVENKFVPLSIFLFLSVCRLLFCFTGLKNLASLTSVHQVSVRLRGIVEVEEFRGYCSNVLRHHRCTHGGRCTSAANVWKGMRQCLYTVWFALTIWNSCSVRS